MYTVYMYIYTNVVLVYLEDKEGVVFEMYQALLLASYSITLIVAPSLK